LQLKGDDAADGGDQGKDAEARAEDPVANEGEGTDAAQNVENVAKDAVEAWRIL
jgi:hypothetical protein